MYICKNDIINSYYGNLKKGAEVDKSGQSDDLYIAGYLRKMTDKELKKFEDSKKKETCQDIVMPKKVNKEVMTKVIDTKPRRKKRRSKK